MFKQTNTLLMFITWIILQFRSKSLLMVSPHAVTGALTKTITRHAVLNGLNRIHLRSDKWRSKH